MELPPGSGARTQGGVGGTCELDSGSVVMAPSFLADPCLLPSLPWGALQRGCKPISPHLMQIQSG